MDSIDIEFLDREEKWFKDEVQEEVDVFEGSADVERIIQQQKNSGDEEEVMGKDEGEKERVMSKREMLERINRAEMDDEFDMILQEGNQREKKGKNTRGVSFVSEEKEFIEQHMLEEMKKEEAMVDDRTDDLTDKGREEIEIRPDNDTNDEMNEIPKKRVQFSMEDIIVEGEEEEEEEEEEKEEYDKSSNDINEERPRETTVPAASVKTSIVIQNDSDQPMDQETLELMKAQRQWDEISTLREEQNYGESSKIRTANSIEIQIRYKEVIKHFDNADMSQEILRVADSYAIQSVPRFLLGALHMVQRSTRYTLGRPLIKSRTLEIQRRRVLCLTKISFDHNKEVHGRTLFTIYKRLTGDALNCPPMGSHWETIGFQGSDPSTDLRGAGMLSLVQLLEFLDRGDDTAMDIYQLSKHPLSHFPYCIVSINMTALVLEYLKNGALTPLINSTGNAMDAVNACYRALFCRFHKIWKQGKTIAEFDKVKKQLGSLKWRGITAAVKENA